MNIFYRAVGFTNTSIFANSITIRMLGQYGLWLVLTFLMNLFICGRSSAAETQVRTTSVSQSTIQLNESIVAVEQTEVVPIVTIGDLLGLLVDEFLIAKGDVTPEANAYHPEFGETGYSNSYYGKVDPAGKRTTLNAWKQENGFNSGFVTIQHARYINASDLGFGRKMYCIDNGRSSCYVQNYLDPLGASTFAATVTMERMPQGYVAFFVYDSAGKRINQIALDSEGPKSVPESCWACHGGSAHGSSFYGGNYLPFDIDNLKDWPGHPTRAAQLDKFKRLNDIVWSDAEYSTDNENLVALLEHWYSGPPFYSTATYANNSIPTTWFTNASGDSYPSTSTVYKKHQKEKRLYKEVYGEYCRLCHVAQDLDWQTARADDFSIAAVRHICSEDNWPRMPHAELTYDKFFKEKNHSGSLTISSVIATQAAESSASNNNAKSQVIAAASAADPSMVTAKQIVSEQAQLSPAVAGAINDIAVLNNLTGAQLLCNSLGLSYPSPSKANGALLFNGCLGCHFKGYENFELSKVGGNLECKGAWLRHDMSTIDSSMGFPLTDQKIQDLAAFLNDDPDCD